MIAADYPPFSYVWVPAVVTTLGSFVGVWVGAWLSNKGNKDQRAQERQLAWEAFDRAQEQERETFVRNEAAAVEQRQIELLVEARQTMTRFLNEFMDSARPDYVDVAKGSYALTDLLGVHYFLRDRDCQLAMVRAGQSETVEQVRETYPTAQREIARAIAAAEDRIAALGTNS